MALDIIQGNAATALEMIRVGIGVLLACHGVQKATRHLDGDGLRAAAGEFGRDGLGGGVAAAGLAAVTQISAGALLVSGFLIPLAAAATTGVMTVAAAVKAPHGPWAQHDGFEYPAALAAAGAAVGMAGPDPWSLDWRLPWRLRAGRLGPAAAVAGVVIGLGAYRLLRLAPQKRPLPADHAVTTAEHRTGDTLDAHR